MEEKKEDRQHKFDKHYLEMAAIWAKNSYCKRRQVGALLVKDKMIISDGFNGTPSGFENQCEDENDTTKPYVLHAEANAITKVAKSGNSSEGATLYITTAPCIECAKLIIQSGIERVVYAEEYRKSEGIELLKRAKIEVENFKDDEVQ
ncbi:MAG: dCMP deaminase family protein [Bacteroidales bacterium]|nr:dCMP deaminase family protein [Bacteroidales bacterium]